MKRLYRRCKLCGLDWNVSKIEPGGKDYICPTCDWKRRLKKCTTAPAAEKN